MSCVPASGLPGVNHSAAVGPLHCDPYVSVVASSLRLPPNTEGPRRGTVPPTTEGLYPTTPTLSARVKSHWMHGFG